MTARGGDSTTKYTKYTKRDGGGGVCFVVDGFGEGEVNAACGGGGLGTFIPDFWMRWSGRSGMERETMAQVRMNGKGLVAYATFCSPFGAI